MATANWPKAGQRSVIGRRSDRVDGPMKSSGAARYSYDHNFPGMLWAKLLGSPHAYAEVVSIDLSPAQAMPGVKGVWKDDNLVGKQVRYAGQVVAAVAAVTEEIAQEAIRKVKVEYKPLKCQVLDDDPKLATGRPATRTKGDVEKALAQEGVVVSEGEYGLPVVTHCCLEAHGQVAAMRDGELYFWPSTQNVSGYGDRVGDSVGVQQNKVHVDCQYMGGGFGSKFNYDQWGVIGAKLAKQTGRPVKLMLERDMELAIAGNRPSAYSKIKVGVRRDGALVGLDAEIWGTGGNGGYNPPPTPYIFTRIPNSRVVGHRIPTNRGSQRAWRAPNHPQACLLTMSAVDDAAAKLGMDALEFFLLNAELTGRADVYKEELKIAADLIGYRQKAHPRGDRTPGPIKRGLGMSMHTWGGRGHPSNCEVTIHADGSVEVKVGSQDLGTGTRTVITLVVAETLGLPVSAIDVKIGRNSYPRSGASGGSTTVGGVSTSSRLAATDALNELLAIVGKEIGVEPSKLEARNGHIVRTDNPSTSFAWGEVCELLGPNPISKTGTNNPGESQMRGFISSGVGGVQMADVSVDTETGVVTMNEMVGVQDCGLIIDLKTAESQVYGAMIMGITYSLFEETVYDAHTGRMLNADMEFYRLAGLTDIGKLKVHMMTGKGFDERGVIGLGEPPVISPGAAISNAVANALGVRIPRLPLTPDRVLDTLQKGGLI